MIPSTYNLPDAYRGDTYGPIIFSFTNSGGAPISLSGVRASVQFKNKKTYEVVAAWDTIDNTMSISGNSVTMLPKAGIDMEIPPSTYAYDLQLMSGSFVKTYIKGDISVYQDITDVSE
jgi:hypothetical protein